MALYVSDRSYGHMSLTWSSSDFLMRPEYSSIFSRTFRSRAELNNLATSNTDEQAEMSENGHKKSTGSLFKFKLLELGKNTASMRRKYSKNLLIIRQKYGESEAVRP